MGADTATTLRGRYLIFHLAEQAYAVPAPAVEEIVPMAELVHVAAAPSFLSGFLNVGGCPVAVISLRRLFGLAERPPELYTPLVILKDAGQQVAIEVDDVQEVAWLTGDDAVALGDDCALNGFATAAARLKGKPVLLLSPDRLLLEQEKRRVAELAEMAGKRLAAMQECTQ
jgi:purine-binding chemotaxis protein CheW